jgi:hypothetical protein
MAQLIQWAEPPNSSTIGSILIYRAVDNVSDMNGIRNIIATIGAHNTNNAFVTSYTDVTGATDYYYRIQYYDGVGSSELSDPVSAEFSEILASLDDVRRAMRLSANSDLGSEELYQALRDATDEIFEWYGDPIKKTTTMIRSTSTNTYPGSLYYTFTGNRIPVYQVREITVGTGTPEYLVSGSAYTVDYNNGLLKFTPTFISENDGAQLQIEWVPKIFNTLCKFMAALQLVESTRIADGNVVESPEIRRLQKKVDDLKEILRPKGVFGSTQFIGLDERGPGTYIDQDFENIY